MNEVYVNGKRIRLDPAQAVGKGGEADVFKIDAKTVVKVFKQPDHPDVAGNPQEEKAARARLDEHQRKLREFPDLAGMNVVTPIALATDVSGSRILGYTMALVPRAEVLLRWAERPYRTQAGLDNNKAVALFRALHGTLRKLHAQGVVVGDFNDLNVLVAQATEPWLIDADSFQFGAFFCRVFTERFVDPLLCDPKASRPLLVKPHNPMSDWYAFNVMLFKSLLYCDPYGGIHRPARKADEVLHAARPLHRITVFDKDVRYPKPAIPYDRLSDVWLDHFEMVFKEDRRREFPEQLLASFRWTQCDDCGTEHARPTCPVCKKAAPAAVKETVQVRGKVTSTRIFRTTGEIIFAAFHGGVLRYVYWDLDDRGETIFRREDGHVVVCSYGSPQFRWRVQAGRTLFGSHGKFHVFEKNEPDPTPTFVDSFGTLPLFDANEQRVFWVQGGILYRRTDIGQERIGEVLENQTLFWVGPNFGFGFYRAGLLSMAFVFETEKGRLNDTVKLPSMKGHVMDSTCYFTGELCWFFVSLKEESRILNRCVLLRRNGEVVATAETDQGDGSWLGEIRGKCASGTYLFSVTDDGIVRLESSGPSIVKSAEYPDTEPFVHAGCHLFPGKNGLHVVDRSEIRLLKIG
jgi:tRNA A-37 threonylcarbamoyl transferase component Bud32